MTKERVDRVLNYVSSLKNTEQNPAYFAFLDALSNEEKEAYFYIDAHRMNEFIKSFSNDIENQIGIAELKNPETLSKIKKSIIKSDEALKSLIEFWDAFGTLDPPKTAIRQKVINKHNEYVRLLTGEEQDFFLHC